VQAKIPEPLEFLFEPHRYKVAYGGRGGAKSWGFARALLIQGWEKPLRILCAREYQNSIKDSVHKLLSDQIQELGLSDFYYIEKASIQGKNGTEFSFEGIKQNTKRIKSYEGVNRCWVEEAKDVSWTSWETIIPTIRREDSEIWVTFNPELETDETYERFVLHPPADAIVRKINWRENPWFPEVLRKEKDALKARDEDAYLNIWEGHCRVTLEGAIYAAELRLATSEGRITKVPYDETVPVHTFWDLGWSDCTSIWFAQKCGFEYHIIDFFQDRLKKLPVYIKTMQDKGYVYGIDYLPHDGDTESLGSSSIRKQLEAVGHKVVVLPRIPDITHGINATRQIFNRLWFDETKCKDGLQNLRHYRYEVDENGQWSKLPLHDENSHAADGLRTLGESIGSIKAKHKAPQVQIMPYQPESQAVSWLGT
jgi:phage terminase large subunit